MGQRSQYVFEVNVIGYDGTVTTARKAGHFQWVFGAFMAQRSGQVVHYLLNASKRGTLASVEQEDLVQALTAMIGINHASGEVQGLSPRDDVSQYGAEGFDNNNGLFLLSVTVDRRKRFETGYAAEWCFGYVIGEEDGGDFSTVVTLDEYAANFRQMFAEFSGDNANTPNDMMNGAEFTALVCEIATAEQDGHRMDQATAYRLMATPVKAPEASRYVFEEQVPMGFLWTTPGIKAQETVKQPA